jgi:signal recognition particle GTPase
MASALTDKLTRLVKEMRGQARITESNVTDMLREVRMALLEADVALPVVRDFIARVKDKALGQEVMGSLKPGQALVGIVNLLNPKLIIVGGGIGESCAFLVERAAEVIDEHALAGRRDVRVVQAELGNDAGVLGAAALAFDEHDSREGLHR